MSFFSKTWKKVRKSADTLHLHSVSAQLDVKKLVTNPKGYFSDQVKAYKKDVAFGATVYARYKKGSWKSLVSEAVGDTAKAFGASKEQQMDLSSIGGLIGTAYEKYKSGDYTKTIDAFKSGDYAAAGALVGKTASAFQKSLGSASKAKRASASRAAVASGGSTQAALLDTPGPGEATAKPGLTTMHWAILAGAAYLILR